MSTLSLRLPDSSRRNLRQAADADGISERAKSASRAAFLQAISLVPRGEIIEGDEPRQKKTQKRRGGSTGGWNFRKITFFTETSEVALQR